HPIQSGMQLVGDETTVGVPGSLRVFDARCQTGLGYPFRRALGFGAAAPNSASEQDTLSAALRELLGDAHVPLTIAALDQDQAREDVTVSREHERSHGGSLRVASVYEWSRLQAITEGGAKRIHCGQYLLLELVMVAKEVPLARRRPEGNTRRTQD